MDFYSFLLNLDHEMLKWIHHNLHNDFLNRVMILVRRPTLWIPLYLFFIFLIIKSYHQLAWIPILLLSLCVGMTDATSTYLFKKQVQRLRPCHVIVPSSDFQPLVNCGGKYSFTSNHASNHMGIAVFMIFSIPNMYKRNKAFLVCWALLIGLSQIFVGVHYPFDVLGGFCIGFFWAWLIGKNGIPFFLNISENIQWHKA